MPQCRCRTLTTVKLIPRPQINNDDAIGRGMDLVLVTVLFVGIGYGLDRWLGTKPVFMIVMLGIGVVGQFVAMRYRYEATMQNLEAQRAASTRAKAQPVVTHSAAVDGEAFTVDAPTRSIAS